MVSKRVAPSYVGLSQGGQSALWYLLFIFEDRNRADARVLSSPAGGTDLETCTV